MTADLLVAAGVILALDQASKLLVIRVLAERKVVSQPIHLRYLRNASPGLGLVRGGRAIIVLWAVAVTGTMLAATIMFEHDMLARAGLGAALGGATGNLLDRVFRGAVVDFIDLRVWPVFNLADVAITAGGAVALVRAGFFLGHIQGRLKEILLCLTGLCC